MISSCIVCHRQTFRLLKLKQHTIKVCQYCGLGVTLNFRSPDYSAYHRDDCYEKESALVGNYAEKHYHLSRFRSPGKTVLEVGCSTGSLLRQFTSHGWSATGIEPSKTAANYASEKGLAVTNTDLEHFKLKGRYSLVIMIHVLEHVNDPKKTLQHLAKLVNRNGRLFVSVPNFGSLTARLFGQRWSALLPNEHRWHFTQKSLSLLLEDCGFEVIRSETNAGVFGLAHPIRQLLISLFQMKKIFFRLVLFLPYDLISTKLNIASNLIVTGQKTK